MLGINRVGKTFSFIFVYCVSQRCTHKKENRYNGRDAAEYTLHGGYLMSELTMSKFE